MPVATRPHTEDRLTPPLTLSGEDLEEDEEIYLSILGDPDNTSNAQCCMTLVGAGEILEQVPRLSPVPLP